MGKPRKQAGLWVVHWSETYVSLRPDSNPWTRSHSKKYKAERFARDHLTWLKRRVEWTGRISSGFRVNADSIEVWFAPVGDWERVELP